MKHGVFERKIGRAGGICGRKSQTLLWYNTNFKCRFGIFFNKTWDYAIIWIDVLNYTKKIDFYNEIYVMLLCEFSVVLDYDEMNCLWYNTNFKYRFGMFFNKTWDYAIIWIDVHNYTNKHTLLQWILCYAFVWILCSVRLWWNELHSCFWSFLQCIPK
jgi:hypothetical protein